MYDVVPKNAASTDVENAAVGYLQACKDKIQKLLNNLVCSKQNSVDQSSQDFNHHYYLFPCRYYLI